LRAISPAGVQKKIAGVVVTSPSDHFGAGPDRRVSPTCKRRVCSAGSRPTVNARIVSSPCVKIYRRATKNTSPDDHFTPVPNGRMRVSRRGRVGEGCCDPTVHAWVVRAAGVCVVERFIDATPDDHVIIGPYRRVSGPAKRDIYSASRRPTVRNGIISTTRMQIVRPITSTPNSHVARIVFRPAVQGVHLASVEVESTPNDHFTAGPYSDMIPAGIGRIDGRRSSPRVIDALCRNGDFGKLVAGIINIRGAVVLLYRASRVDCERLSDRRRHACRYSKITAETLS
jgi:hypothetical protein